MTGSDGGLTIILSPKLQYDPRGVAVDNTTGAPYMCDTENDRVVVY